MEFATSRHVSLHDALPNDAQQQPRRWSHCSSEQLPSTLRIRRSSQRPLQWNSRLLVRSNNNNNIIMMLSSSLVVGVTAQASNFHPPCGFDARVSGLYNGIRDFSSCVPTRRSSERCSAAASSLESLLKRATSIHPADSTLESAASTMEFATSRQEQQQQQHHHDAQQQPRRWSHCSSEQLPSTLRIRRSSQRPLQWNSRLLVMCPYTTLFRTMLSSSLVVGVTAQASNFHPPCGFDARVSGLYNGIRDFSSGATTTTTSS